MIKAILILLLSISIYLIGTILFATKTLPENEINVNSIYQNKCFMCHGKGQGNGPSAKVLAVQPPDWTSPGWQLSVTDFGIRQAIIGGGKSIGRSAFMPAHPELENSPELDALVKLIRKY